MDKVYNFSTGNAPGSFNDLYTKYERLGRGGFGYVFKVEHNPTKEILAVKEMRGTLLDGFAGTMNCGRPPSGSRASRSQV